ncbi:head-tail adaptor protein [Phaeobacter sp. B1627]|uniref:head-tail adaptor protein n=1 Tax=Phaeobacter sp. B1627 TaxID=2583809 RepID=UPI001119ECFC|nr:head-tail adaptor protein [Phaeobacter sp. B1627]TNJ46723.1 head-tail adaptor protein [Phaeobacter sp. B1627]
MTAPRLNRPLRLEDPQAIGDGAGGFRINWAQLGVLWADVEALSGRETGRRGTPVSLQRYRITLRAAPVGSPARPKPDQRFREGTRLFKIDAVAEHDRDGRYLTCLATEELAT